MTLMEIPLAIKMGKSEEEHPIEVRCVVEVGEGEELKSHFELELLLDSSSLSDSDAAELNVEEVELKVSSPSLNLAMEEMVKRILERRREQSKLEVHPQWKGNGSLISEIRRRDAGRKRKSKSKRAPSTFSVSPQIGDEVFAFDRMRKVVVRGEGKFGVGAEHCPEWFSDSDLGSTWWLDNPGGRHAKRQSRKGS